PSLFEQLNSAIPWRQDEITLFGKRHRLPRLQAWYGDPGASYRYSGLLLQPTPWQPLLNEIRRQVETLTGLRFNSALANLYRDGNDAMGWHSDDEAELGVDPAIASVSFGASRRFLLRHRRRKDPPRIEILLTDGSLLLMAGPLQTHWHHALPRSRGVSEPRINLTFRLIRP
ncbi:MAG TPA: alpha-ketoglutarate-dependent dioxygenase AlkB, partial [Pseudomonadales bacterium]|nr:alpha-ketoglutarate-dependent dioxygenase AlkB [Pseudomonadales bacterium]HNH71776.1 alpha-ketoglutarate-dependent dioxygenase AlkB [Pseudomonadales bacterium]